MDKVKEILTKYWVGILCGVIAIVAIVAAFVPLGSYHEELHGKLQKSAGTYSQLNQLMTASRFKPKTIEQTEQEQLAVFPSQSIIDSGKELVKKLEEESKNAMSAVITSNKRNHDPLVKGVFPNPAAVVNGPYVFRDAYNKRLNPADGTLLTDVLKSTMPPTEAEIKAEGERKWRNEFAPRLIPSPSGQGDALNKAQIDDEFRIAMDALPGQMRQARAQAAKVYMAPTVLAMDKAVSDKLLPPPRPEVMWWAQMALWVQEDVAAAIAEANAKATDVTSSRVKHLLMINVPIGPQMIFGKTIVMPAGGMMTGSPDQPAAGPTAGPNDPVTLDYARTPSGRTTGGLYDVVQYQVEMIVAAKELSAVLSSFADNRLVTVLNVESMWAEDGAAASKNGFLYGPDPVVRVMLRCESLFLRDWTTPLMPENVRTALGIPKPAPANP